jgi:DNA gyrase subunit A
VAVVRCTTDDVLLLVDEQGTGYRLPVGDVPVVKANQRGTHVAGVVGGGPDAPLAGAVPLTDTDATLVTVSAAGQVKRTALSEYAEAKQRSLQAAGVKGDDRIVAVTRCRDDDHLLLANDAGLVARFSAGEVRVMGRSAAGVAGMKVPGGAEVVAATVVPAGVDEGEVATVGADGTVKRTPLAEYPAKGRGGKGVVTGTDALLWCGVASDLHVHGERPQVLRPVDLPEARRAGRGTALEEPVAGPVVAEDATDANGT